MKATAQLRRGALHPLLLACAVACLVAAALAPLVLEDEEQRSVALARPLPTPRPASTTPLAESVFETPVLEAPAVADARLAEERPSSDSAPVAAAPPPEPLASASVATPVAAPSRAAAGASPAAPSAQEAELAEAQHELAMLIHRTKIDRKIAQASRSYGLADGGEAARGLEDVLGAGVDLFDDWAEGAE